MSFSHFSLTKYNFIKWIYHDGDDDNDVDDDDDEGSRGGCAGGDDSD